MVLLTLPSALLTEPLGAGPAGSSCAYYLEELASSKVPVEITIFERGDRVGGRTKLAHVDDELVDDFEVGASTFSKKDRLLMSMMEVLGLEEAIQDRGNKDIGVWEGSGLVFYQRWRSPVWWNRAKFLWKYGLAPFRTQALAKRVIEELRASFEIDNGGLNLHSTTAPHRNLEEAISTPAEAYLAKYNILPPFSTEIIQASTRKRYAQNLDTLHGLAAMMAMSVENTTSVKGGNWRLFNEMVNASKAHLNLNSQVTQITRHDNGTFSMKWKSTGTTGAAIEYHVADFDAVVVAVPAPSTSIDIQPPLDILPSEARYVQRHVTHFITPGLLNPALFGLSKDAFPPNDLRTTLNASDARDPGLFQITVPQYVLRPSYWEKRGEMVYKVITPLPLNNTTIAHLLGLPHEDRPPLDDFDVHWMHQQAWPRPYPQFPPNAPLDDFDVHWVHRQAWPHAYPELPPKTEFYPISPARNLYFSSEIETIESSLEMSSLMGRKIARILFRDLMDGYGDRS